MAGRRTFWDLSLEIAGKDKGATQALKTVKHQIEEVQKAGKQLGADFKSFTSNATKLALGVAGGVAAATAGIVSMANSFAETGDKVAKTSDRLGIGIEAYQGLSYAMQQSGLSAEEFDGALEKFNLTVRQGAAGNVAAAKQLQDIGLSAHKLASMKPEQAMERLSDYMRSLPSDAERTRVAVTLFGKTAGPKMMAAMKQGSAGMQDLMKEAKSLGIVMTEEQAHQSESFISSRDKLLKSVTGFKNQFIGGAIGPLTEAFDHLKDAVVEQMPAIQELGVKFGQWIGNLVTRLPEIIAKIKEFAANVWDNVNKVKDFVGGWKNLGKIIAGIAIAPTLISGIKVLESSINLLFTSFKAVKNISGIVMKSIESGALKSVIAIGKQIANLVALNAALIANKTATLATAVAQKVAATATTAWGIAKQTAALIAQNAVLLAQKVAILAQAAAQGVAKAATVIWTGVQWALNAAMSANPIGLIIIAVAALIAIIVLLVKNWDKVKEVATKAWEGIKAAWSAAGEFFSGLWDGIKNVAGKAWDGIKNVAGSAWEGIKGGASKAGSFLKDNWKTIAIGMVNPWAGGLKALYDHNEKFRNFVDKTWGKIKDITGKVWDAMPDGVKSVFIKISDTISGVINGIKDFFTGLWGAIKQGPTATIEYLKNAFFGLFDSIKQKIESFVNFFKEKMEAVKNFFGGIGEKASGFVGGAVDKIKSFLPGHAEGGIFRQPHIAQIAERGAEAVVPLNKSSQGFDLWKQAGEIGGYIKRASEQTATMSAVSAAAPAISKAASSVTTSSVKTPEPPPVMEAAAQKISTGDTTIRVEIKMTNNFSGGAPTPEVIGQLSEAGNKIADDIEEKIRSVVEKMNRDSRRVQFA